MRLQFYTVRAIAGSYVSIRFRDRDIIMSFIGALELLGC